MSSAHLTSYRSVRPPPCAWHWSAGESSGGRGCVGGSYRNLWNPGNWMKMMGLPWFTQRKWMNMGGFWGLHFYWRFFWAGIFLRFFLWIWTTPKLELDTGHFTETRDFTYAGDFFRSEMGRRIGSLWQRDYVVGHPPRIGSRNCKKPPRGGIPVWGCEQNSSDRCWSMRTTPVGFWVRVPKAEGKITELALYWTHHAWIKHEVW